ncbi:hypothetical protein [Anabaena sp. PCC 7108]|uniref:hypothetical protein n=1 Tax=Anabaena sp. PCC 7108 TaxID=163908 RepID=UPI000345619A|nr:hypothetical protein [Anabaena sp. PCC 7108]
MSYCQAGETARVTFPDDSTGNFDGPIDIDCQDGLLLPERINVDIYLYYKFRTFYGTQNPKQFYDTERSTQTSSYAGYSAYTPVLGSRFRSEGESTVFEILYFATSQATQPTWFPYASVSSSYQQFLSCNITAIKKKYPPDKTLVIQYAELLENGKLGSSRWILTIPHYNKPKEFKLKMPDYSKGDYEAIKELNDNSKIIVNAASETECIKVINACLQHVPEKYTLGSKPPKVGKREKVYKKCKVTAVRSHFFLTGQKDLIPTWSKSLREDK